MKGKNVYVWMKITIERKTCCQDTMNETREIGMERHKHFNTSKFFRERERERESKKKK